MDMRDRAALIFLTVLMFSFGFLGTAAHRMVLYVSGIFLIGVVWRYGRDVFAANQKLAILFVGFLFYNVISVFFVNGWSGENLFHAVKTAICIGVFVFAAAAMTMGSEQNEKTLLRALIIGVTLSSLVALMTYGWQVYSGAAITPYRLTGFGRISRSTKMGEALAVVSLILLYKKDILPCKISRPLLLAFNMAILFVTWGRGAIAGFVSSVLVMTFSRPNRKILIGGIVALLVGAVALFLMPNFVHMLVERGLTHRDEIWMQAFDYIREKPIFGYGISHKFRFVVDARYNSAQNSPHNILLGALLYGGIVGAGILIGLVVLAICKAVSLHRARVACYPMALFLFGLVVGQVTGRTIFINVNPEWLYTWIPLALLMGIVAREKMKST